jgi:hypothetical protein
METEKMMSLTLSIPKSYRNLLRRIAAEQSLKDPDQLVTSARLAREIICEFLKEKYLDQNQKEA